MHRYIGGRHARYISQVNLWKLHVSMPFVSCSPFFPLLVLDLVLLSVASVLNRTLKGWSQYKHAHVIRTNVHKVHCAQYEFNKNWASKRKKFEEKWNEKSASETRVSPLAMLLHFSKLMIAYVVVAFFQFFVTFCWLVLVDRSACSTAFQFWYIKYIMFSFFFSLFY